MLVQQTVGDDGRYHRAIHQFAALIDGEHAVGIAIEGGSQVGVRLDDLLFQIRHVLRLDGAGRVVGEVAVQFKVHGNEFAGQVLEDFGDDHTRHTVAGVDDNLQRSNLAHI